MDWCLLCCCAGIQQEQAGPAIFSPSDSQNSASLKHALSYSCLAWACAACSPEVAECLQCGMVHHVKLALLSQKSAADQGIDITSSILDGAVAHRLQQHGLQVAHHIVAALPSHLLQAP